MRTRTTQSLSWKRWLPTPLRRWLRLYFRRRVFQGDYPSWAAAGSVAEGYQDPAKSDRVIATARDVRRGLAAWDRDGVLFHEPLLHEPLVAALRNAALACGGKLAVIDFGGGLGSTWWQHRAALVDICDSWRVVDGGRFVEIGKREFSTEVLSFHSTLESAQMESAAQVILLSSVLPYLEDPHSLLREIVDWGAQHVIVDRTPFVGGGRDRLVVQSAPADLGGGRYPCWLFDRAGVAAVFHAEYELEADWLVSFDEVDENVSYCGLHFRRRAEAVVRPTGSVT